MIKESYDVVLVDFSGILPFRLEKDSVFTKQEVVALEKLKDFIASLESELEYEFVYLGMDFIETKLFHRMILKDGILELLIGTPITLMGHFREEQSAIDFRDSLEKTLSKTLPDLLQPLLEQSIEMRKIAKEINPDYKKVGFNKLGGN
jgi:hypothetical protein